MADNPGRAIHLNRVRLKHRTFLLGNKRAFSLSLPAAAGPNDTELHQHKWFGAYLYGRKFLEGQLVSTPGPKRKLLNISVQNGFTMTFTSASREYTIDGAAAREEYFVADRIQGIVAALEGEHGFIVEPEFDMRFYRALCDDTGNYVVEQTERGCVVSNLLPAGTYDDETETFLPDETAGEAVRIYAAVEVEGPGAWAELLPTLLRSRVKRYIRDRKRSQFLVEAAPPEARHDHAPLWNRWTNMVYAPIRLHLPSGGRVLYGFGDTREEALAQVETLRAQGERLRIEKARAAQEILAHASLQTGDDRTDAAYAHVLTRLLDVLVAREAVAQDTALSAPATMILAGNQYFHDSWKRDENIALGFLLSLGFYDLARDVIRDTWQLQDSETGRLPQRIRAGEEPPYHSSDGTLWALWRLQQYWRCSGDDGLLREKLPMVAHFFRRSLTRTVDGLLPSGRTHDPNYLWETWMDTPYTPRDGFPVEIQLLWIACLGAFRSLIAPFDADLARQMAAAEFAATHALQSFQVRGTLADSVGPDGTIRDLITPNPYFAFGLGVSLDGDLERSMRQLGRTQLAGSGGIATLAPVDWPRVIPPEILSDPRRVRGRRMVSVGKFNYHRGVEWNWLMMFFVLAELKYGEPDAALRLYLQRQIDDVLDEAGIGGINEVVDLSGPRGPEFQTWSMAGFLEALQAFAGVHIDVPGRTISIAPQTPARWQGIQVRKWYGKTRFDMTFRRQPGAQEIHLSFPEEVPDAMMDFRLVLPLRHSVERLMVRIDGEPFDVRVEPERLPGTERRVACWRMPAAREIDVALYSGEQRRVLTA